MSNLINSINKALKTKEDVQTFVLIAFVVFIIFVKCYMLIAGNTRQTAKNTPNTKTKTVIVNNSI